MVSGILYKVFAVPRVVMFRICVVVDVAAVKAHHLIPLISQGEDHAVFQVLPLAIIKAGFRFINAANAMSKTFD